MFDEETIEWLTEHCEEWLEANEIDLYAENVFGDAEEEQCYED